jgi:hypothetical protein
VRPTVARRWPWTLAVLAAALLVADPAPAQPPLQATLLFGPPFPATPGVYGPADPIVLILRIENTSGNAVLTTDGFSATEFWRRLYFTDPFGRLVINAGEASVHRENRVFHCLSRSGALQPTAIPVVPVEALAGPPSPFFLEYVVGGNTVGDDARKFFDLSQPGRYSVNARIPFATVQAGDLISDCDQFPGQDLVDVGTGLTLQNFTVESNALEFEIVNTTVCGTSPACAPVTPVDSATGSPAPVTVTFREVTQPGSTTLTSSSSGAPPPANFSVGNPPTYYDISTTAGFTPPVTVCINYDPDGDPGPFADESQVRLFHFEAGAWQDVTTSLDMAANVVCGEVTTLSPFAPFQAAQPPVANAGPDQLGVLVGTLVTLDGTASTPSGLSFDWTQTAGPAATLLNATTATPTLTPTRGGTYTFSLTVRDSAGTASAPDTVNVSAHYVFGGFKKPRADARFRIGRDIAVQFELLDASGHAVSTAAATFSMLRTDGPGGPLTGAFQFHPKRKQYEAEIETAGLPAGSWRIDAILDDGTTHSVTIRLR